jgi:serine/threonine protein kinase/DNA polymerase III delta prime subunit
VSRVGLKVLRARYRLVSGPVVADVAGEAWIGVDDNDSRYFIKLWPFEGDRPDDLRRALWDAELRTLYRVGSSPGAEDTILVLRDAGVDRDARCFVMVLEAPGYDSLAAALRHRAEVPWLAPREAQGRRALWAGLQRLATGIRLLHEQYILHRDVRAETVFYSPQLGAASLRLGGFEWSVRLGTPRTKAPPPSWSSPPEFFGGATFGYRPETDWFGFGMLAVRALLNVESYATNEPVDRHRRVLTELERSGGRLSDLERAFLVRLIAADPRERITRGYEVLTAIQDVLRALEHGPEPQADSRPLVVVVNPNSNHGLLDRAHDVGFTPNPEKPQDAFNPNDVLHTANLTNFVQQDLARAQLYAISGAGSYLLVGANLILVVTPFEHTDRDTNATVRTWDLAFCTGIGELRWNEGGSACVELPPGSIVVRTRKQVQSDRAVRQNARSWERYLPNIDRAVQLRASLARFHDFIRCTNQLELLIRDSEIFRYRVQSRHSKDGVEHLTIKEVPRKRRPMSFCELEGGMAEFLLREIESGKRDCRLVVLTGPDEDALTVGTIDKADCWTVDRIDGSSIELVRVTAGRKLAAPAEEGTIRTWGMFGQVELIRRRKRAIDRIEKHSYLLRSLSAPGQVYMDTGSMPLPVALSMDLVDEAKQAAIEDILRVRPIYALQGPPGTGKTTLVAHLLRQIFDDDPVAQVLITAQAHGAVDVLRAKVRDEAFHGIPEERQPLAVRLGISSNGSGPEEGSVEEVSLRILQRARARLKECASRTALQDEWLAAVTEMERSLMTWTPDSTAPDFCEVVKRGANVTYCTTSAGDLEVLAEATQSFDWAIVEEAGKAHGFDLALPLQAGHRWLLIGDHKQLPPYRFKDYREGIDTLDDAVAALEDLPERAGGLLDIDWIRGWRDLKPEERSEFKEYARRWLNTFERIFEYCSVATGSERLTVDKADGAAAGRLSRQHRMHPTIGDLISVAYYNGDLVNRTLDEQGAPLSRVRHPFKLPAGIEGKAIVWLDLPWAARNDECSEVGPANGKPRYTNPKEVEALGEFVRQLRQDERGQDQSPSLTVAVLSPYNQQVALINRTLREASASWPGLSLKQALRSRTRDSDPEAPVRVAHTVDSFQGNQADIIAVSLVRNNSLPVGDGLGFLDEAPRINVLLSRAERLLVLVGSWEFFERQLVAVPLDDPQLPLWHWKKVLATLNEWFASGRALRIPVGASQRGGGS